MKHFKKIGLALGLVTAIALFLTGLNSHKVFALTQSDFSSPPATYTLQDKSTLKAVIGGTTYTFTDANTSDTNQNYKPDAGQGLCQGNDPNDGITITGSPTSGNYTATLVSVGEIGGRAGCNIEVSSPITITVGGGGVVLGSAGGTSGTGDTAPPSCYSNYDSAFKWIMCPALNLIDSAMGVMNNFVEDQLTFCTGTSSTQPGQTCANNMLNKQVEAAWAIFRNLATGMLVIVLLVALISQAVGGGNIIDAYTLRKMLPRIVAAVILIQISFVACKWFIDLSNDLGVGVKNLLYAPFGGSANMTLGALVGNGVTTTGAPATFSLFVLLAGTAGLVASLPALLSLGVFAVLALLTAFAVLILRRLLILLLVILAPVALVLWILPGTEKYWKRWQDNFIKLLLMFPLIMGIIAAGRIFAYITTTTGNIFGPPHLAVAHLGPLVVPYFGTVTDFVSLAIIIFAFFGPYFFLPKTFSMGGQMMSAASGAVQNSQAARNFRQKSRESAKNFGERQVTGRAASKYNPTAGRFKKTAVSLASGRVIPSKYRQALLAQQGAKWKEDRQAESLAIMRRRGEVVRSKGYKTKLRMDDGAEAVYQREVDPNTGKERFLSKEFLEDGTGERYTDDVDRAAKRYAMRGEKADEKDLVGVQAMKQMWVDMTEQGKDDIDKSTAVKLLRQTSSWPEMQGAFTQSGKRVVDTDAWRPTITNDQESYPAVLRSRVDHVPHLDDAAQKALDERLSSGVRMTQVQQQDFKSGHRILNAVTKQMSNEDFSTQSDGFWEEMQRLSFDRHGNQTEFGGKIQTALQDRFNSIQKIGGNAPQQLLGHLASGGNLQRNVNSVLTGKPTDKSIKDKPLATVGDDEGVIKYITQRQGVQQAAAGATAGTAAGVATATGGGARTPINVEVPSATVLADTTQRQEFKQNVMNNVEMRNAVATSLGDNVESSPADRNALRQAVNELRANATVSPESTAAYNDMIDRINTSLAGRTQRIVNQAVSSGRTPEEVARVRNQAEEAALREMENYQKINPEPSAPPSSDGTVNINH